MGKGLRFSLAMGAIVMPLTAMAATFEQGPVTMEDIPAGRFREELLALSDVARARAGHARRTPRPG